MQKKKLSYICNNCGYISSKWQGKCSSCQKWNSFEESIQSDSSKMIVSIHIKSSKRIRI